MFLILIIVKKHPTIVSDTSRRKQKKRTMKTEKMRYGKRKIIHPSVINAIEELINEYHGVNAKGGVIK